MEEDTENVRRVIETCRKSGIDVGFKVHAKAETVEESSENTGVEPGRIVKTLVFKSGEDFVAVMCPGDERVSEQKLGEITGDEVRMARPDEVKQETGYIVGGVSPFDLEIPVYMEESIMDRRSVKPAAGSRVVGVEIEPQDLKQVTDAETAQII